MPLANSTDLWERRAKEKLWPDLYQGSESLRRHPFHARRRALRRLLRGPQSGRCLDLGCATGDFAEELRCMGFRYHGADRSWGMLNSAEQTKGRSFVQSDAQRLPFAENSFQALIALGLLGFVNDPAQVVSEMRRVLQARGILVVQVGKLDFLGRLAGRPRSGSGIEELQSLPALDALMEPHGFQREALEAIDFVFLPGRLRMRFPRLAVAGSRLLERAPSVARPLARSLVVRYRC